MLFATINTIIVSFTALWFWFLEKAVNITADFFLRYKTVKFEPIILNFWVRLDGMIT